LVDYRTDLRTEKIISAGGDSEIYYGNIVNTELSKKYGNLGDEVAIKKLLIKTGCDKQELFYRLQQEVAVMHTLSTHPNIVKLLCYTIDPPTIVTPLYAGNLGDLIHAKNQVYTSLDLIHIIYQFLSTMDTIHNRGIAHRDLKPANILLENRVIEHSSTMGSRPRGEWSDFKFRIKIADFGISYVNKDEAPNKMNKYS